MTAANEQIVVAYEQNGMTPEEIAEDTGFELLAVKAILLQNSAVYRKIAKKETSLQFSDEEAEEMKTIMLNLARYSDDDKHLQYKAARYVMDSKAGRLDIGNSVKQLNVHIISFNEQMKKALAAEQRTIQKAIEIEASVQEGQRLVEDATPKS